MPFPIDKAYSILAERFQTYHTPIVDLIEAQTKDPFKVLVATILSARTKDETTAKVVGKLFQVVHNSADLNKLTEQEIDALIYPVGFHKNKAKFLKELHGELVSRFQGQVPEEIDDLVTLPGVGRKTANLVRAIAYRKPAICVDVHVHRITNRWGYVQTATPFDTEMQLRKILPEEYWLQINSYLVAFGQNHCTPINPHCDTCPIAVYCQRVGVKTKHSIKE